MVRPGDRNTAFTGEMLRLLRDGIPGGGSVIDANALFESVEASCRVAGLPLPARQMRNNGAQIPLVHNEAYGELAWQA